MKILFCLSIESLFENKNREVKSLWVMVKKTFQKLLPQEGGKVKSFTMSYKRVVAKLALQKFSCLESGVNRKK